MNILGISPLDKNTTVSIVEDGKIIFAAAEERFTRVKNQTGFPWNALEAAFNYTRISPDDIDSVVYAFLTWEEETELFTKNLEDESRLIKDFQEETSLGKMLADAKARIPERIRTIPGLGNPNEKMEKGFLKNVFYRFAGAESLISRNVALKTSKNWQSKALEYHKKWQEELELGLEEFGLLGKLKRYEHHLSHAANSYYMSGFDRALIVTLDGYGSGLAGSISLGESGKIKWLHKLEYPHSLGTFYESVTSSLGFKPSRHEGKVVGLAAYGNPNVLSDVLLSRFIQEPGSFKIFESNNVFFSRHLACHFPKIDVAAAYQNILEKIACDYIEHWVRETKADSIVFSGGVAANVKLNQRIFEIKGVERIFIYPNMGDGGCGTGLALMQSWPGGAGRPIDDVYFGPSYSDKEIERELAAASLSFVKSENLAYDVALKINQGKVVARFDGRMEYGPRALGNRSIMYHAKDPEVNQWLNQRLGRTEFMPFAPVTLYEAREQCYKNIKGAEHAAEFMTITFDCTKWMRENCPAAVHIDGTARPQLIRREINPGYYDIIAEYEKLSGIPCLINTSFNMHEEPIVCTPNDAIRSFLQGNIDSLIIGPFLVQNPITYSK